MSALGAVPGFAYPELDFSGVEFLLEIPQIVIPPAGGQVIATLVDGGLGSAVYVDDVQIVYQASAAVGNRTAGLAVTDGDGHPISFYTNPLLIPASLQQNWNWAQRLTTVYTQVGTGYSPMQNVILIPGFTLEVVIQGTQLGDTVVQASVTGRRIPYGVTREPVIAPVAPILLT